MAEGEGGGFFQALVTKLGYEVDTEGLESLKHSLESIAETTKLLLGVELVRGLAELSERFAGMGEELESSAIAAGLTTEELQKLQFAASQNAVGAGSLNMALSRLGRLLYQAQNGSKGAAAAFEKLGISQDQIAGFQTTEDALYAIQDGVGRLGSQQEKLAVVQQLFGRSGARFLKFLEVGSDGTKKLKDRAAEMGAVVSDRGVKALAEFEDAASGLGQVLKAFFATMASSFAPSFIGAIESIEDAWANNRQIISEGLDTLAQKFAFVMGYLEVTIGNTSRVISAILYKKGGIGEYVKTVVAQIYESVSKIATFVLGVFKDLIDDGSLAKFFGDTWQIVKDVASILGALAKVLGEVLGLVTDLMGIKGDGLSKTTTILRATLAVVDALAVSLEKVTGAIQFLTSGGLGSFLGSTKIGEWYDKIDRLMSNGLSTGTVGGYAKEAPMPLAAFPQVVQQMGAMGIQAPTPGFAAGAQDPGGMRGPTIINSTTNVTAPPGMTSQQAGELFAQKHSDALTNALRQADRDSVSALDY